MEQHPDFESSPDAMPVRLEHFEGPLDLLLHLIRKSELNIYDIPIALITAQYLETIQLMQELNLDVAGALPCSISSRHRSSGPSHMV